MKILFVCESAHGSDSGGRVVRYLTRILGKGTHQIKLLVVTPPRADYKQDTFYQDNDVEFLPIRKSVAHRMENLVMKTEEVRRYRDILKEFRPDIVHFASFDHNKPAQFITEARMAGAKVILQPWTMQFYCAQGFGFREGKKCNLCAGGNYINALTKHCVPVKGIPSQVERSFLHKSALKADVFLSSNTELDQILLQYGVEAQKIARFPIPFDYTFLVPEAREEEDYFIFFGQPAEHKGLKVLMEAFKLLPDKKLKMYPLAKLVENENANVEVVNGIGWASGLKDAVAAAKAVLVPSLWSTSTEYAMCEALLFKKAVVLFNVGVHKDIFRDRDNAMVVEPDDIPAFAKAISELDADAQLRRTIGENGYKTLLEINNRDKLYAQLMEAYTKTV